MTSTIFLENYFIYCFVCFSAYRAAKSPLADNISTAISMEYFITNNTAAPAAPKGVSHHDVDAGPGGQ